jgi:hypothetical protein
MRDDTTAGDRGLDKRIQLLISADGQLQVARRDTLDLEVLGRVACQLQHLGRQVLHDGGGVHGGRGAHTLVVGHALLQEAVDAAHGELRTATQELESLGIAQSDDLSRT